ncbi:MAG: ABC transporter ATP-binding protein [Desulfobacula sp.]|uniref:ABC transporter ATP-binding protein n=2 Tax=Desulfobacula sp. TaxID=2593537 RepID=UPI001D481542|nr:ABC transporter ATP-binding protein [Desulfobacula sp.]MBT3483722.1 ABC transporter ATP-binding protein [Desulfobacula sp.]MBT3803502.1 ABC transporter ATP-binding protein [Desulfobacula sp.]MBT4023297.1 ABC transporter ATP-binding protein [Desulfobacula sp.]MBT4197283.1 ABC transporter ATP-binding protein [Desulfobacula sp.]
MNNLLEIKNLYLEAYYEEKWQPIVHDISFDLKRGEVLGLIGESGAGKSTIGLAAMGYARQGCRIASGSINLDGIEMFNASNKDLRKVRGSKISYVAQSAAASFNPAHRVIKQYAEAPVQHGLMSSVQAEKEAIELYERLFLPSPDKIGYRYPHELSGGQLQRAMVAMAMSCKPDIIVFDEPTTALDVTTQIEVLAAVKEITEKMNKAALYITHDLAVVAQVAHRIMVLRNGRLVEMNETRELIKNPKEKYTRELLNVRSLRENKTIHDKMDVILNIKNVAATYTGDKNVVEDIDLTVRKGRTVALVGESGSGKSTVAKIITGLLPANNGSIKFLGKELPRKLKDRVKDDLRKMQMIYQMPDTALNPKQTVRKVIGRPLEFYFGIRGKEAEEQIRQLLVDIELDPDHYIGRLTTELSGGEKQRICIARALAAKPDLIICDEVTSALDQLVAEGILDLLQDLQNKTNMSYLFITHDLATVKAIADKIVIMLQGKIVEQGAKKEILTPPHHEYTDKLLASVPEMDPDWLDNLLEKRASTFI